MKRPSRLSARFFVRYHVSMMAVWVAMLLPTLLWWKESILWVTFMSLYANFVGHFGAWNAARSGGAKKVVSSLTS